MFTIWLWVFKIGLREIRSVVASKISKGPYNCLSIMKIKHPNCKCESANSSCIAW